MNKPSTHLFVLDTNVLMHDPSALFRFQEHDVFIPMVVLEELDAGKKGTSEVARNARQASRFIEDLINASPGQDIDAGLALPALGQGQGQGQGQGEHSDEEGETAVAQGRLFLQTRVLEGNAQVLLPGGKTDNTILSIASALHEQEPHKKVTLVSKDINLRIKARVLGISVDDYASDKVLDDAALLYTGVMELDADFWNDNGKDLESWQQNGSTFYKISGPLVKDLYCGQCLFRDVDVRFEAIVRRFEGESAVIERAVDYRNERNSVWGINARNREQNYALNLLMDPEIDFVTLLGTAGTGKTLLTLAAGLNQAVEMKRYREIVMTRVTVPVGEDIGFLPGTEEEKMTPWMGALLDNLEVLTQTEIGGEWGKAATNELLLQRIKIRSLNFMRGRTFLNRYLIIDEAQNLTAKQMKTLITRAGPGTKVVCLGNIGQIDTPYLTETTSGLTYVVDHFKSWPHSGHIILQRGERSRLADYAAREL